MYLLIKLIQKPVTLQRFSKQIPLETGFVVILVTGWHSSSRASKQQQKQLLFSLSTMEQHFQGNKHFYVKEAQVAPQIKK